MSIIESIRRVSTTSKVVGDFAEADGQKSNSGGKKNWMEISLKSRQVY